MKFELGPDPRNISNDDLINDIIRVAKLLAKKSVTNYEYRDNGKYGLTTIRRRFGSWSNAIKKAGLPKTRNYDITDEELQYFVKNYFCFRRTAKIVINVSRVKSQLI